MNELLERLGVRSPASWVSARPIAHRGLHGLSPERAPENSMAAFDAAIAAEHPIELDVRLTADNDVVVFHDATLDRLTGVQGPVCARTARELSRIRLAQTEQTIPSLVDVLEHVAGRVPLLVELKNPGDVGALEAIVAARLREYDGPVAVQSFNPWTVAFMAQHAPTLDRGLLSGGYRTPNRPWGERFVLRHLLLVPVSRPQFIGYELDALPSGAVDRLRALGMPLLAWTARGPGEVRRALRLADNVIFEGVRDPTASAAPSRAQARRSDVP